MIEFKDILEEFHHRLQGVAALAGSGCVWKVSGRLLPEPDLPRPCYIHEHPFCLAAKAQSDGERCCVANDTEVIAGRLCRAPYPFVNLCHAGAAEIIVPIPVGGEDECIRVAMIGPFRPAGGRCPPEFTAEFSQLPELDVSRATALMKFTPEILEAAVRRAYAGSVGVLPAQPHDERILQVLDWMGRAFRDSPPVARAAERAFMSPSRFIHLFKAECGVGYRDYLLRLKLREARRYLLGGNWPMSFVAANSGFADQSYFSAMFRREYGLSPLAYRRKFGRGRTLV